MRLTARTGRVRSSPIGANAHLLGEVPDDRPLLDLSQGAPGFPPAPEVSARMAEVALQADGSRYTPIRGLPHLREAFAAELSTVYRADIDVDDVCITAGCNQAFAMVVSALCAPGDEVVLTLPYYFNHDMWLALDGVTARYLRPRDGLDPTVSEAQSLIGPRTRALVLVSPGNPTGHTLDAALLDEFAATAAANDVVLILDETYRSFVPGGSAQHEIFAQSSWREHVVSLHSFSKDLAIPGQRVGAIVGSPALLDEVAKLIDCVTICAPRIGQEAAYAGLTEAGSWRKRMVVEVAEKQARFSRAMHTRPGGFELLSTGAYYGWVRHQFAEEASEHVVERLLIEQGVLAIAGTAFMPDDEQMIRFSFANIAIERLDELAGRLSQFAEG